MGNKKIKLKDSYIIKIKEKKPNKNKMKKNFLMIM